MALFKILRGDSSRIDTTTTPFHDGYAYFTPDDGGFYIDADYEGQHKRVKINPGEHIYFTDKVKLFEPPVKGQLITMNLGNTGGTDIGLGTNTYRILKMVGNTTALCLAMYEVNSSIAFDPTSPYSNVYSGSNLDTYLNTTWYNTLSTEAKEAIIETDINQYKYTHNPSAYNATTHASYAYYSTKTLAANVGNRNVFALEVEDIEEYFGGTSGSASDKTPGTFSTADIWTLFWNTTAKPSTVTYPWLRSANAEYSDYAWIVYGYRGDVYVSYVYYSNAARPAFTIDLSKIYFEIVE